MSAEESTSRLFDDTHPILRIKAKPAKDLFGSSDDKEDETGENTFSSPRRRRSSLGSVFVSPIRDKSMNSTPEKMDRKSKRKLLWKSAITSSGPNTTVPSASLPPPIVSERSIATPEPPSLDHVKIRVDDEFDDSDDTDPKISGGGLNDDVVHIKCREKLLPATRSHRLQPPSTLDQTITQEHDNDEDNDDHTDLSPIDHVVLVVHGINGSEESLESNLARFRESIDQVKMLWHIPTLAHVELINWKSAVIGIQSSLFERITPREMSFESRMFINFAISDAAFYLTPSHCELIQSTVVSLLNDRVNELKLKYRKKFAKCKYSLVGYSLGSVILHDILSSEPTTLDFQVENLFFWGSPLSAYLSVKDREYQNGKFQLPRKMNVFNIYLSLIHI